MHRSTLIKPLPPSFLFTYNLSTSLFGCSPPYIVIAFLDFLSKFFSSLAFYWIIPAPYLNIATAHLFITVNLFLPFNLDFKMNLCLRLYSLVIYSFVFVSLILSNSGIPKYEYLSCPICFITSPYGSFIPSIFYYFTSLPCKNPTFIYPKLHANVGAKHLDSSHKRICLFPVASKYRDDIRQGA